MRFLNSSKNLTLILPVDCNANCSFCFWKKQKKVDFDTWLEGLTDILINYEKYDFTSISISGGEPTLNKEYLLKTLRIIRTVLPIDPKVVLNTNGYGLAEVMDTYDFVKVIKHINLSRHGVTDELNKAVINSDLQLSNEKLKEVISKITNDYGIDVSLNTVFADDTHTLDDLNSMYDLAKQLNCSSVTFRQNIKNALQPSKLMELFKPAFSYSQVSSCLVCKEVKFVKYGFETRFKYGLAEPTSIMNEDEYYEYIYNENGQLCFDWAGLKNVNLIMKREALENKIKGPSLSIKSTLSGSYGSASINQPILTWPNSSTGCGIIRSSGC